MNKRFSIIIVILFVLVLPVYLQAGGLDDSLRVVSSDENGIVLELEAPWPDIAEVQERGTLYQKITMPDFGKTADAGNPELPLRGVLIGVPDAGVPDIEALDSDYTLLQGYNIYPAPRPVVVEEEGDKRLDFEFVMDKAVYSADAFFPFEVTKVGFTGFMRDQKVVKVIFSPVQFNPVTGEVKFYSRIRVRVNFNTPSVGRGLAPAMKKSKGRRSAGGVSGAYEGMLKGLLLNYDEMRR